MRTPERLVATALAVIKPWGRIRHRTRVTTAVPSTRGGPAVTVEHPAADSPVAELLFTGADTPISTGPTTVMAWTTARDQLAAAPRFWLATGRPDRRPHVTPVVAVWSGNALHIATRPASRKGRNLASNPHCVLATATDTADLVVECRAAEINDPAEQQGALAAFEAKYQWRLTVRDGAVHDDSLPGSPVYGLHRLAPTRAFGYGPDGLTATRWRFTRSG